MRTFAQKQNQTRKPVSSNLARSHTATPRLHLRADMMLHSQRTIGNQAVQRILHTRAGEPDVGSAAAASPRLGHDFSRMPLRPPVAGAVQAKRVINEPGDAYEQEADRVAERVMNTAGLPLTQHSMPQQPAEAEPSLQRVEQGDSFTAGQRLERLPGGSQAGGSPLPNDVRSFMEPRFGFDFSQVRIHTDLDAMRMSRKLNAQAFTEHQHIYYGAGRSPGTNALTAHELTHVVQQAGGRTPADAAADRLQGHPAHLPGIQRDLEVRPPGPHDASAFDRRQELIDRLNAQSAAIQYRLDGREIRYDLIDEATLTNFDRQMRRFIDRAELVPMRLTTGADRVGGGGNFTTLLTDSLRAANVDLDDLMADDDFSFRSDLVHFLTERFSVRNYARRIGAEVGDPAFISAAEFSRGHRMGKDAEAALLQEFFNDPSIQFNYDESLPNRSWLNNFRSRNHGYQVFQVVRGTNREIAGGEMFVRTRDGRRVTMNDFRAERAAAAPL
jgi:hypothetical protein